MLPRSKYRPRQIRSCRRYSNPVILHWITGFFHSTGFCISSTVLSKIGRIRQAQPAVVRWALFFTDKAQDKPAAGDHRPSDFDLPINPLKNRNWRITMKEINLREFYPFYTQDAIVEVPDEVAALLHELKLAEAASFLRTYRHKAYFSLDYDTNVERDALVVVLTPADILEQKEENDRLYQAIASLPEKQRNRITSHFLLGMSISEIAKSEGSGASSVHEGIQRGLRRLKKILKKMESDPEKNA